MYTYMYKIASLIIGKNRLLLLFLLVYSKKYPADVC